MKYPDSYLLSHDIDWFFQIENKYVHVASAGGLLPEFINDRVKLRNFQHHVFNLPYIYSDEEIIVNKLFIQRLLEENSNDDYHVSYTQYIESFINFSRKGFISMDRTYISDSLSDHYHIVCSPKRINHPLCLDGIYNINSQDFPKGVFDDDIFNDNMFDNYKFKDIQIFEHVKL